MTSTLGCFRVRREDFSACAESVCLAVSFYFADLEREAVRVSVFKVQNGTSKKERREGEAVK